VNRGIPRPRGARCYTAVTLSKNHMPHHRSWLHSLPCISVHQSAGSEQVTFGNGTQNYPQSCTAAHSVSDPQFTKTKMRNHAVEICCAPVCFIAWTAGVLRETFDCESRPRPYRGPPASPCQIGGQKHEAQTVNAERYPVFRSHAAALQCRSAYAPNGQHCGTSPQPFESATFSLENARVVVKGHSLLEIRIIFS
jgi:hypothetical protein